MIFCMASTQSQKEKKEKKRKVISDQTLSSHHTSLIWEGRERNPEMNQMML